jgi:predicted O-methyltransferase YrrM
MKLSDLHFQNLLQKATNISQTYVHYSTTQIERGEHLLNDPHIGERAWSIPETTGRFLYSLITHLHLSSGLELGTSTGYSALWIAAALSEEQDWTLITIEKNEEKINFSKKTLQDAFGMQIQFESMRIEDYLPSLGHKHFDFIFMDAERGKYIEYWRTLRNCLHEKSIVVIDNALRDQESVHEFQDFLKSDTSLVTYLHPLDNGLFLVARADGYYSDLYSIVSHLS